MIAYLFSQPALFFIWVIAFVLALSVHEFSHALAATLLGDSTARRMGRLTLNPLAHVDMMGFLAVLFIGFGWGKPVPFNQYALKWPKWGSTAVAGAGPLSNLVMACISALLLTLLAPHLGCGNYLIAFLDIMTQLNVALMVFNLIPLPPLDGSKALLAALFHPKYAAARNFIETRGTFILLGLIIADSLLGLGLFAGLFSLASGVLGGIFPFPCL